jgi:Xaa-Pro aminopeptidase
MLQSFEDASNPSLGPARLALLRGAMAARQLDGYIIPRADEHQGEYVPACADRLRWLSGFTGSAGACVVLAKRAALFVDGRYTMQAAEQADGASFDIVQIPNTKLATWLADNAGQAAVVGFDPKLFTPVFVESLETALSPSGVVLKAVADNLVDTVWTDRPAPPAGQVTLHRLEFAGVAAAQKITDLQAALAKAGDDALIVTLPDSIAWLFNIRGADLRYTPFALSYAVVPARGRPAWFIDPAKLDESTRGKIATFADVLPADSLPERLAALGGARAKVRLDPNSAAKWFADTLAAAGASVRRNPDPCQLAKAKKNATELDGARAAHNRDAVAVCRLLAWLDREAMTGALDEIAVASKLEGFRHDTGLLKDLSFDSISAAGPHAALPHYRVNKRSNIKLAPNSVFLIDSGGQYEDGTTDITRTIAIGDAGPEARERFTLVLKGMIAVSLARFPAGTRGCDLDPYARRALWAAGLDFDHGTGHGIGSYLSVHEGPQGISKGAMAVLEPGMIVSNEPGYYKAGHYGIRIENLVVVTEASQIPGGERLMHGFETISWAPIDRAMIELPMLTAPERDWLNAYHAKVRDVVGPQLPAAEDQAWLDEATAVLA